MRAMDAATLTTAQGPLHEQQEHLDDGAVPPEALKHHVACHEHEDLHLSILGFNPPKRNGDSTQLLERLPGPFHVIVSHQADDLEKLLVDKFYVRSVEDGNIVVALRKSAFAGILGCTITHHDVAYGEGAGAKNIEGVSVTCDALPRQPWRGDENASGPCNVKIAVTHVHRLSANARADKEVVTDFLAELADLAADITYVNFGTLDLEVLREHVPPCFLRRHATSALWSCIESATLNTAFLLRRDMQLLRNSRVRRQRPVTVPEHADLGLFGRVHIVARSCTDSLRVPQRVSAGPSNNLNASKQSKICMLWHCKRALSPNT